MRIPVIPSGNLDLEQDAPFKKDGDYIDANDVTCISENGNTISWERETGNRKIAGLGTVTSQVSKKIRIYLEAGSGVYAFDIVRPTQQSFLSGYAIFNQNASLPVTITNAVTELNAHASQFTVTAGTNYVDIEFTSTPTTVYQLGYDFTLVDNHDFSTVSVNFKTIREGINGSMLGDFQLVSSYDLLGDFWSISTTQRNLPEIQSFTTSELLSIGGGFYSVVIDAPNHGLSEGEVVEVTGLTFQDSFASPLDTISGEWIVKTFRDALGVRDPDKLILGTSSIFGVGTFFYDHATIVKYTYSLTQIGVHTEDVIAQTISFTSLVRTQALRVTASKQPKMYMERTDRRIELYFTDGLNPIRVLYYYGTYLDQGFLIPLLSPNFLGIYDFDTIETESRLLLDNTDVTLTFKDTIDSGGELKSGNYRYAVRFLTESLSASDWTQLSDIINIYKGGDVHNQFGDMDGTLTGKINRLDVTGIPDVFKYIELAYVLYSNSARVSYKLPKILLSSNSITLTHTGFEVLEVVDLGTLNFDLADYQTAESIDGLDNRLIISNLTSNSIRDFSTWFQTFTHTVERKITSSAGLSQTSPFDNLLNGEFYDTQNTYFNKSLQVNETYRFGAHVKLRNGKILKNVFWVDDIKIDNSLTNTGTAIDRRDGAGSFINWDLNDADDNPFVFYLIFRNIDWSFRIDGVPVFDLVDKIYIDMVEMTDQYKEILGTGLMTLGFRFTSSPIAYPASGVDMAGNIQFSNPPSSGIMEYNLDGRMNEATGFPLALGDYGSTDVDHDDGKKYAAFYSPDFMFGSYPSRLAGDAILYTESITGRTLMNTNIGNQGFGVNVFTGKFRDYISRDTGSGTTHTLFSTDVDESHVIGDGGEAAFASSGVSFRKRVEVSDVVDTNANHYDLRFFAPKSLVVFSENAGDGFKPFGTHIGNGSPIYGFYYRNKGAGTKFGNIVDSTYVSTGSTLISPHKAQVDSVDVYGDTFVQQTYIKLRAPEFENTSLFGNPNAFNKFGWGFGASFYSQNRVNSQMRFSTTGDNSTLAPKISQDQWTNRVLPDPTSYTHGYDDRNEINLFPAFDPNAPNGNRFETRIAYSDKKPNNSPVDNYRTFLPLNFRDLDMVHGAVVHHAVGNGELLTWQARNFERQYFNSNALISSGGTEIILGDGAALERRGLKISSIGTSHSFSIVKGKSKGGNDTFAWWNTELGFVIRYGYDGVNPISTVHNVANFIKKNTVWADVFHSPAKDLGIHGVWHDNKNDFVWTVRGRRQIDENNPLKYYFTGDIVSEKVPSAFIDSNSVQNSTLFVANGLTFTRNSVGTPIPHTIGSGNWQILERPSATHTPSSNSLRTPYPYNELTISFNELKNGFSTKHSYLPKIMGKWKKSFISPSPVDNGIYLHDKGNGFWYDDIPVNPYIQMILNKEPDVKKDFVAIEINSTRDPNDESSYFVALTPIFIEFLTDQHSSWLKAADFIGDELHDNLWTSWIKNDVEWSENLNNLTFLPLSNENDTSNLFGRYLIIKYRLSTEKLFGVFVKIEPRSRLNTT